MTVPWVFQSKESMFGTSPRIIFPDSNKMIKKLPHWSISLFNKHRYNFLATYMGCKHRFSQLSWRNNFMLGKSH